MLCDGGVYEVEGGGFFGGPVVKGDFVCEEGEAALLAPVLPSKIVAIGLNYKAHAAEFDKELPQEPMLFLKPPTAVTGPGGEIVYPSHMSRRVDYEGELAVVMGREARGVGVDEAAGYILGYTCFNDVTARDLQGRDVQYTRAKGFDTFAPMGPWIETELDPRDVRIETFLNGSKRQDCSTADMIFDCFELVSFVSRVMTLLPGDVIATGTPSGVGRMKPGDEVEVRIEGIGSLVNTVTAAREREHG
ncbi:MAG TPA: FAA hydrolase family protein [Deltaproteobacteria bacterium]|nr:FAA hydrolase family protein [Deltaproteobacteria bacterium]